MVTERTFLLYLYNTTLLIIALVSMVLLGTVTLLVLQHVWFIPAWIQYIILTVSIAIAFVSSSYLAARPARFHITKHGVKIIQRKGKDRIVLWKDIKEFAYYNELVLHSFKLFLHCEKTVSIINFKWKNDADFQSFLYEFEASLNASRDGVSSTNFEKSKTIYESRKKVPITITLLFLYICLVVVLYPGDTFNSWNPVLKYYFWVVPAAFFVKMLKKI